MVSIEDVKKYWSIQPCNIKHSNESIENTKFFEDVSKKRYTVEPHILSFMELDKFKNKKVLEVGCGIGTDSQTFAENECIYKGIDLTDNAINICKKRFDLLKLKGEFEVQNIEEYSTNEKFDLIYSFGVLHHTPNIEKAIENCYNMLNDDGVFKLMLYAKNSWKNFKIHDGLDQYEAQNGVPIANVYTKDEVNVLLKKFKNINIVQTHIFPYKIPEYKQHKLVKEDYFECMPNEIFECLNRNLGWHLCITCNK